MWRLNSCLLPIQNQHGNSSNLRLPKLKTRDGILPKNEPSFLSCLDSAVKVNDMVATEFRNVLDWTSGLVIWIYKPKKQQKPHKNTQPETGRTDGNTKFFGKKIEVSPFRVTYEFHAILS